MPSRSTGMAPPAGASTYEMPPMPPMPRYPPQPPGVPRGMPPPSMPMPMPMPQNPWATNPTGTHLPRPNFTLPRDRPDFGSMPYPPRPRPRPGNTMPPPPMGPPVPPGAEVVSVQGSMSDTRARRKSWNLRSVELATIARIARTLFLVLIVILSSLLAAGSTSKQLDGFYIMSLQLTSDVSPDSDSQSGASLSKLLYNWPRNESTIREIRIGYLGLCARANDTQWLCRRTTASIVETFRDAEEMDPLNLLWAAHRFRTEAVVPMFVIMTASSIFIYLNLSMRSVLSTKLKRSERLRSLKHWLPSWTAYTLPVLSGLCLSLGTFSAFNVALWQHQASAISCSMTSRLVSPVVSCHLGGRSLAAAWVVFALAIGSVFLLALEKRRSKPVAESSARASELSAAESDGEREGRTAEDREQRSSRPYGRPPAATQNTSAHLPRGAMGYLAGYNVSSRHGGVDKRRHTAAWVRRTPRVPSPGFVEGEVTDDDEDDEDDADDEDENSR